MMGPFLALSYSQLTELSLPSIVVVILAVGWIYLSIEDALRLSVPSVPLHFISIVTIIFAFYQGQVLWNYFLVTLCIIIIFSTLGIAYVITKKIYIGSADFIVIISFALTLRPEMLGPWMLITSIIPLIGVLVRGRDFSSKIPFIPYLTVGWMLALTLN